MIFPDGGHFGEIDGIDVLQLRQHRPALGREPGYRPAQEAAVIKAVAIGHLLAADPFQDTATRAAANAKGQEEEQFAQGIAPGDDERLGTCGSPCCRDPRAAPLIGLEECAGGLILESKPFRLEAAEVAMGLDRDMGR